MKGRVDFAERADKPSRQSNGTPRPDDPQCPSSMEDAPMTEASPATPRRLPGWLRFVLGLWAIALLLLALQAFELAVFGALGG